MAMETNLRNPIQTVAQDSSSSTAIHFCSSCNKPFTSAHSHDRHIRYCGSRTRRRTRSCRACNAAKTKCSFQVPCLRCTKKGLECAYDGPALAQRQSMPRPATETYRGRASSDSPANISPADGSSHADDGILLDLDFVLTNNMMADDAQTQTAGEYADPSVDMTFQSPSLEEFLMIDGLLAYDDISPVQHQYLADVPVAPYETLDIATQSWCGWMRRGVALSALTENTTLVQSSSNGAVSRQVERPVAHHNANLLIQSLRPLPEMMLRRETFPWYIHQQPQVMSNSISAALPEALSNCMGIVQMFALRTPETKPVLWRTIKAQYRRCNNEKLQMSKFDLLAAVQACIIYLIMCIIEPSPGNEQHSQELLLALNDLYLLCKRSYCELKIPGPHPKPGPSWRDWIFVESQRRLAHLWFLIGCVVCVKTGNTYDSSQSYRSLELPSPKSLWEARTQNAWEAEREANRSFQTNGFLTLGDLMDAQQSSHTLSSARKLEQWNANVDNLGSLLNLVSGMV